MFQKLCETVGDNQFTMKSRQRGQAGKYEWVVTRVNLDFVVCVTPIFSRCVSFELTRAIYKFSAVSSDSYWNILNEFICVYYRKESKTQSKPVATGDSPTFAITEYQPVNSEDENPQPHENSKGTNSNPYYRTNDSIKQVVRQKLALGTTAHSISWIGWRKWFIRWLFLFLHTCEFTTSSQYFSSIRTETGTSRPSGFDDQRSFQINRWRLRAINLCWRLYIKVVLPEMRLWELIPRLIPPIYGYLIQSLSVSCLWGPVTTNTHTFLVLVCFIFERRKKHTSFSQMKYLWTVIWVNLNLSGPIWILHCITDFSQCSNKRRN